MSRALKYVMFIYLLVFAATGVCMVLIANVDDATQPWVTLMMRQHGVIFVWNLVCWMLLGMFANYYWDLSNLGKGLESVQLQRIVLPLLVSPVVFYPVYNLWLYSSSQNYILFGVIAFQSGFFWQALFAKAKPLDGLAVDPAAEIPWTVNNSAATRSMHKAAPVSHTESRRNVHG